MKKIFYVLAVAALFFAGCKGSGDAAPAAVGETPAVESQSVVSGDIVYVQVEAVLAQSDLFKTEGATLQEKTKNCAG